MAMKGGRVLDASWLCFFLAVALLLGVALRVLTQQSWPQQPAVVHFRPAPVEPLYHTIA
jgi:hypothetical protein